MTGHDKIRRLMVNVDRAGEKQEQERGFDKHMSFWHKDSILVSNAFPNPCLSVCIA